MSALSCSSQGVTTSSVKRQMLETYPMRASESMAQLAPLIPAEAVWAAFGSYGSLAEIVQSFATWGVVDAGEFQDLLVDLGTHYQLNPGLQSSYFKAGLDTTSGFAAFAIDDSVVIFLSIDDAEAFDAWWDNFINEEFGRPRYHLSTEDDWRYSQVNVLKRDLATLAHGADKRSYLVLGSAAIAGSGASLDMAKRLSNISTALSQDAGYQQIAPQLGQSPLTVFARVEGAAMSRLVRDAMAHKALGWFDAVGADLQIDRQGLGLRAIGAWAKKGQEKTPSSAELAASFGASLGPWAQAIAATGPRGLMRVSLQTQALEGWLLPMLDDGAQRQWNALKGKLEQKLLGLQFSEQVAYNLEGVWLGLWDLDLPALEDAGMDPLAQVGSQAFALLIPFRDPALAHRFFGKIKVLKRFIPPEMADIREDGDIVSLRIERSAYPVLQIGYKEGLLAVATASAWPTVERFLKERPKTVVDTELVNPKHIFALSLDVGLLAAYIGARLPILREQIDFFLDDFDQLRLNVDMDPKFVVANLRFALKVKVAAAP